MCGWRGGGRRGEEAGGEWFGGRQGGVEDEEVGETFAGFVGGVGVEGLDV